MPRTSWDRDPVEQNAAGVGTRDWEIRNDVCIPGMATLALDRWTSLAEGPQSRHRGASLSVSGSAYYRSDHGDAIQCTRTPPRNPASYIWCMHCCCNPPARPNIARIRPRKSSGATGWGRQVDRGSHLRWPEHCMTSGTATATAPTDFDIRWVAVDNILSCGEKKTFACFSFVNVSISIFPAYIMLFAVDYCKTLAPCHASPQQVYYVLHSSIV